MFSVFRRRGKSTGATAHSADANGVVEKQDGSKKGSILDFFRRSRRRTKSTFNNTGTNNQDEAAKSDREAASKAPGGEDEDPAGKNSTNDAPASTAPTAHPTQQHLTDDDVQKLFSGAPQFSAESVNGRIQASVSFPWDFELRTRDVSDAKPIPHAAFSGSTLHQHLPGIEARSDRSHMSYDVGLVELPSMLSSTGNEPGTVGMGFFVQEPDADILNVHAVAEENPDEVFENFSNFELLESQPEKLGIKKFDFGAVAERLVELSAIYESTGEDERGFSILNHTSSGELYASLFGKLLTPPRYDNSTTDPTGLKVQIKALIRILNLKRVWYDFSNVEWRIRVGQLLFSDGGADMADSNLSEPEDGLSERNVVLLQLLLSCELYTRLEAVANLGVQEVKNDLKLTADDVNSFREMESRKTRWDLALARRFLENIDAKTFVRPRFVAHSEKSLTRTLLGMSQRESMVKIDEVDIAFEPRQQELQLHGLFHFADALEWPDRQALREHLTTALANRSIGQEAESPSIYATPLSTPGTITPRSFRSNRESGYFAGAVGSASPAMTPRSFQLQPPSRLDLNASSLDASEVTFTKPSIGGWLTRSYLMGLIMPGEAICHLLMSALLENDAKSIAALGENANLYGGFVYKGRSFWSKSCVLGRVLACLEGSKECMGWISSEVVPDGYGDSWLDVYSLPMALKRIEVDDGVFEKSIDFLAGQTVAATNFAELTLPQDALQTEEARVRLEGLRLEPNTPTAAHAMAHEPVLSASFDFTILGNGDTDAETHNIPLFHLVQFISAYPCTPPPISALKRVTTSNENHDGKISTIEVAPAHPLHASYLYHHLRAVDLLDPKLDIDQDDSTVVIVVDARGDAVLELLARAWCASVGVNAVIARAGTTCFGCAVREARWLGVRVLIRVGEV